eukprot:8431526-Alexandrium_andersonii.AAC.1
MHCLFARRRRPLLQARAAGRGRLQGYQSWHLGLAVPEGAGTRQGHRCSQAVAGHSGRAVGHLHRVVRSIRRAAHQSRAGR